MTWIEGPIFSATQIADFRICQRRWGWSKLDGIKKPSNASAELGTRVHSVLEDWLKHGKAIDISTEEGQIAASGVQHLPPPSTTLEVEEWIKLHTDVAVYAGKVDLSYVSPQTGRRVVHDHKTTSSIEKWAKDEEELRHDPQSIIYAAEAMSRHGVDEVELSWVYHATKGKRKSKKVHLVIARSEVEKELESIDATAAEMLAIHEQGLKALDLPPTISACEMFGGCAYQDDCRITTRERLKALMAESTLDKFKREKAEKAAKEAGGGAAAAPAAAPAATAPRTVAPPKAPPAINPPAPSAPAPGGAYPAALDLSPLVAALKELAAQHAPVDLRDQMVLAILSSGNVELFGDAYAMADEVLAKRAAK